MKFLMTSSAAIFDLNHKSPMIAKVNYLGCSSESFMRFGQDLCSLHKFWLLHGHNLLYHSHNKVQKNSKNA